MKKYLAPVVITIIIITAIALYALLYIFIFTKADLPVWISIVTAIIFLGLIITMIHVFVVRIKELKKEEKDDYSKY